MTQPRTGWSFDDHTTSTWVPAKVGIPSPSSGPSDPERDESAIWDDPDEATRKLSSLDIARTLDSSTDLEMEWDEDESTTHTYSPLHARAILQVSPRENGPPSNSAPRPPSAVRQRVARPEEFQPPATPRPADPATAGALASIQLRPQVPDTRPRRAMPAANLAAGRALPSPGAHAPQLRPNPSVPGRTLSRRPARPNIQAQPQPSAAPVLRSASAKPTPTLRPVPAQRVAPKTLRDTGAAPPRTVPLQPSAHGPRSIASNAHATAAHEPRTTPLWSAGGARLVPLPSLPPTAAPRIAPPRTPTLDRAPGSSPPRVVRGVSAPPPIPKAPTTGNERAWTQAWEDAQALARTHLDGQGPGSAPPELPPMRRIAPAPPRADGATHRNVPPHRAPSETYAATGYDRSAYADAAVLPPMAAVHQLRSAAHAPVAPLPFEAEEPAQSLARQEIKRLALWSAIPGIALFGAVLIGRVLLAGPAPAPVQAPSAVVAPVEAAPAPLAEPEPAASAIAPAQVDRRATVRTRDASRSRTRTSHDVVVSDDSSSAPVTPRATRAHALPEPSAAQEPAATPVERPSAIGILRLNSRPWSQVIVDGKVVGNTPQMGLRLRAGSHQIELVNPQLGMSKKFKVEIQADEIVTRSEMLEE